jgi:alpha-galactosidase
MVVSSAEHDWCKILGSSAATALSAANAFVNLGLKAVGYQYINTDDTWSNTSRVNGLLSPDSNKWPNGIKAVADEIHGMDLKMGECSILLQALRRVADQIT